jgi:hypothetical protein
MRNLSAKIARTIDLRPGLRTPSLWMGLSLLLGGASVPSLLAFTKMVETTAKQEKIAADLELLTRITSNLVSTVRTIETGGSLSEEDAAKRTVQVKVPRANLRSAPSTDSELLVSVAKGAILLEQGRSGSWIRTTAPTGQDAWISADLVEGAS